MCSIEELIGTLRLYLLNVAMLGVEAGEAVELLYMMPNLRHMGIDVQISSFAVAISCFLNVILIPCIGVPMDKWRTTTKTKALVLIFTSSLVILGCFMIGGSSGKWLSLQNAKSEARSNHSSMEYAVSSTLYDRLSSETNNLGIDLDKLFPCESKSNETFSCQEKFLYESTHVRDDKKNDVFKKYISNILKNTNLSKAELLETLWNSSVISQSSLSTSVNSSLEKHSEYTETELHFILSYVALVGFTLIDFGFGLTNCFIKTYTLSCTAPKDHSAALVYGVFFGSLGGCVVCVLGTLSLGRSLTSGTNLDPSVAQLALLSLVCGVLTVVLLIVSVTTGVCCWPLRSDGTELLQDLQNGSVVAEGNLERPTEKTYLKETHPVRNSTDEPSQHSSNYLSRVKYTDSESEIVTEICYDNTENTTPTLKSLCSWLFAECTNHAQHIAICCSTFFALSSLYSLEVFLSTFAVRAVCGGDAAAPVHSPMYLKYLEGIDTGAAGMLVYYITFCTACAFLNTLLDKLGWRLVVAITFLFYAVFNVAAAMTSDLTLFYMCSVGLGLYRAVVNTVPYILANQNALMKGCQNGSVVITTVASVQLAGFSVAMVFVGPLLEWTGDPGAPLYYSAITTLIGGAFLKLVSVP